MELSFHIWKIYSTENYKFDVVTDFEYRLVLFSNQSGITRKINSPEQFVNF